MTYSYRALRNLSKEKLIEEYNKMAGNTQPGLNFIREEIWRRDLEEHSQRMEEQSESILALTSQMRKLTWFIAILTLFNVVLVVSQLVWVIYSR